MPIIPFVGQQTGRSVNAGAVRYLNLYPHMTLDQRPVVLGTPGLELLKVLNTPKRRGASVRGMLVMGDYLYVVAGPKLYKVATDYTRIQAGTLASSVGPVSMAHNGTQLILTDGIGGHLYTPSIDTFADIPTMPVANTVCFLDGYFICNAQGTNTYFYSSLYDGSTWNALDYNAAEAGPDNIVAVASTFGLLYVFGQQTLELHYNAGDPDSVFRRVDGAVSNLGCLAPASVAKVGETGNQIIWLATTPQGAGFVVSNTGGSQTERLSTEAVEYQWSRYPRTDDAVAYGYTSEGHVFYVISFPSGEATWVYDLTTSTWHERQSDGGAHWGIAYAYFDRRHVVGSRIDGSLYNMSLDLYTDDGSTIIRELVSPTLGTDEKLISYQSVQIDMERGGTMDRSNPFYDDVVLLCHGNGAEGGVIFTDAVGGHVITPVGTVQTDTGRAKFGGSSILLGSSGALTVAEDASFGFGTGDYTIEGWVYFESVVGQLIVFDFRSITVATAIVVLVEDGVLKFFASGTRISTTITAGAWHHIAACRKAGVTNLYLNGVPGTPWTASTDFGTASPLTIGSNFDLVAYFTGSLAEIRITNGTAQYDGAFNVPTGPFLDTAPVVGPELMLQWSDDAGHTWCSPVTGAIGAEGDYTRRVIFRRLGRSWRRTWKLRVSDPVKIAIIAATVKTA
jgi:hypothetical protein